PQRLRHGDARGRMTERLVGVAVLEQRERAFAEFEPRELRNLSVALEQAPRALQPTIGDGVLAPEGPVVPSHPDGDSRRAHGVLAILIQAVSSLPYVEHDGGEIEPPGGDAEPFERLRRLLLRYRALERLARFRPGATFEGVPANLQ